jgi:hypothetical protein
MNAARTRKRSFIRSNLQACAARDNPLEIRNRLASAHRTRTLAGKLPLWSVVLVSVLWYGSKLNPVVSRWRR